MSYFDIITNKLYQAFSIEHLALTDESFMHNVPAGTESHFKLIIVTDDFLKTPKVRRHQSIYNVLSQTMQDIHALSIQAFTIEEFNLNPKIIHSPECSNRDKK
ncbi:BolA/IbaG family iron-sulfur metabolism protein [Gammaproteobacteria bacterium]|nr:BolA/IbaG family iron-sulfur metabolism protein [Gammaproteobacteria bacterium]